MKKLAIAVTIALTASPALAHGGAHLHPHGGEAILTALFVAGIAVIAWRKFMR